MRGCKRTLAVDFSHNSTASDFPPQYLIHVRQTGRRPQSQGRRDRFKTRLRGAILAASALTELLQVLPKNPEREVADEYEYREIADRFRSLRRQGRITERNINDTLRQIRRSLLEADVNFKNRR